jgi:uridine kinase
VSRAGVEAALLARLDAIDGCVRLAVTGVDGAGKTRFADALAGAIRARGRPALRVSIDDFHNPRALRYAQGRASPEGFFEASFDYAAFRGRVLAPLEPGGDGRIVPAAFDHVTDSPRDPAPIAVPENAVLVVDGIFLIRPELAGVFDLTVMLDIPFAESFARMALRDGCPADPAAPDNRRYRQGQEIWLARCAPRDAADMVIDNSDWRAPRMIRDGRG